MLDRKLTTVALVALVMTSSLALAQNDNRPALVVPTKIIDAGTVSQ